MRQLKQLKAWSRSLFFRKQADQELDEELQYHLERQIERAIAAGVSPQEARYTALREMGDVTQNKEACRDARGANLIDDFFRNVRHGWRGLGRSPGFTFVALLTLALGIGANAALFSVVDAVLLRPLAFRDPDKLAVVFARNTNRATGANVLRGAAGAQETGLSIADLEDFRARAKTVSGMAAATGFNANLTGFGDPRRVDGESVTPNFFSLLGVAPQLGRDFSSDDDAFRGERSIILSDEFWRKQWGGDPKVVGQNVSLDQASYRIVGVLPPGFRTPHGNAPELFRSIVLRRDPATRGRRFWSTVARLNSPNVEPARAELASIASQLAAESPATNRGITTSVLPLRQLIPARVRAGLIALIISVGLVLLIACSNIANLLLVRTSGREREIATRKALGASSGQLLRQFLTENLLLAMLGGVLGLAAASWLIRIIATSSADIPGMEQSRLDWRVAGFAIGVTLLSGLLFSLLPILRSIHKDAGRSLANRSGGADLRTLRFSNVLVVMQVSIAVLLLIESGLVLRSFVKLQAVEPGFREDRIIAFQVSMSRAQFKGTEQSAALFAALNESIRAVPGVESVGATLQLPISGLDVDLTQIGLFGRPVARDQEPTARLHVITPDYLATLGIPLARGRFFTDADGPNAPGVAIVNQAMARKIWGDEDPIGQRFSQRLMFTPGEKPNRVVVGVVGNVKHFGLEFEDEAQMYIPHRQSPWPAMYFVVRTGVGLNSIQVALKQAVWSVDGSLPVEKLSTMETVLSRSMFQPRIRTVVIVSFGLAAILLAAIGIYGVVSYRVAQRRKELAIRLALGAEHWTILGLIFADGAKLALLGAVVGCAAAWLAAPAISGLLYGVRATDPSIMGAATGVCVFATILACLLPASRATRVDPMIALRLE
jgi:predicted permease